MKICTKRILISVTIALFFALLINPISAKAADITLDEGLDLFLSGSEIGDAKIGTVVGKITKGALSILGLVALVIFIIAGFQWMTSGGDKEKIKGAQKLMGAAVVGLIIVIISYAAVFFIVESLKTVTDS